MTEPTPTILIVADDALLRLDVANILAELGEVQTVAVDTASKAQAALGARTAGCAIIDLDTGEENVLALARALASRAIPLLIISSFGPNLEFPADLPPPAILEKPFAADVLRRLAKKLLASAHRSLK